MDVKQESSSSEMEETDWDVTFCQTTLLWVRAIEGGSVSGRHGG